VQVAAGNRLPGTPERSAFAELAWRPVAHPWGFQTAIEAVHTGKLHVNDANDDAAPAATVFNLRASFAQQLDGWRFTQLLRLENAADKHYAGSVIVGEANRRYFEPAPGRQWLVAFTAQYAFR
jgi:iron complex outermembrane receptor protein